MDVAQIEQFHAIAECGTMREAAERLYLSQPALSHSLKKLEKELGCQLFSRDRNRLRLTPYGEVVLERTRALLRDLESMSAEIEDMRRREEETLHIGCFSMACSVFLMPQVAAELPGQSFDVVNCVTADLVGGLGSGRFDALLATDICRAKGLRWKRLYTERAYVSAPKESGVAALDAIDLGDLSGLAFSIEDDLPGYSDWYHHILRQAGIPENAVDKRPLKEHMKVKDSLPTCNLITSFIMEYVRTSKARAIVPIEGSLASRDVGIVYRSDAPAKVMLFVDFMARNADALFGGNSYFPYFMAAGEAGNLRIASE